MTSDHDNGSMVGAYVLEARLGGGSFGTVWRARDTGTGEIVAIKLFRGAISLGDSARMRTEVEVLAAAASSGSQHVVRVLAGGVDPVPHIVMEYIDGTDLAALLADRHTLELDETVRIGLGVADALGALHPADIIHRDVKPANVMIERDGNVKLGDFGIAKIAGYDTITATGQLPMTMAYAAPEVWEGHPILSSDLYALGVLLYQCLAGVPPFSGDYGALYKHHTSTPPDLDALPGNTPVALSELIRRCLEKDPDDRPANAAACIDLLDRAAAELTAPAVQEPAAYGPWIPRRPHATQMWAWRCDHETTGETAVVEVHAFQSVAESARLRAAVDANPRLVALGAQRLLGMNRIILRPGESWREAPAGAFQFWVARDELPPSRPPSEVSVQRLRRAADALFNLIAVASAEGIALSLAQGLVSMLPDGAIHVRRPGLAPASSDAAAEAMAFLRTLPLNEDARDVLAAAPDLQALRSPGAPSSTLVLAPGAAATLVDPVTAPRPGWFHFGVRYSRLYWYIGAGVTSLATAATVGAALWVGGGSGGGGGGVLASASTPARTQTATVALAGTPPYGAGTAVATSRVGALSTTAAGGFLPTPTPGIPASGGSGDPTASSVYPTVDAHTVVAIPPVPTEPTGGQAVGTVVPVPTSAPPTSLPPPTATPVVATATPAPVSLVVATNSTWEVWDAGWTSFNGPRPTKGSKVSNSAQELACPSAVCPGYSNDLSPAKSIWAPGTTGSTTGAGNARYWFIKEVDVPGRILSVTFASHFDNGIKIWIDDSEVSGSQYTTGDVTNRFDSDTNHTIEVWGVNAKCDNQATASATIGSCTYGENPAGVDVKFTITYQP